jgi:hypothetical protein
MRQKLRSHMTYANVMATIAVFVALGGTAIATHETILSSDIVNGEVKTPDLANLGVTNAKLGADAVSTAKVFNNNLRGVDLLDGTVATADLATRAVTPAKVGTVPAAKAEKTSGQTVPTSTNTPLTFESESFDTAALHNNTTSNENLRAPISGIYQVSAGVFWDFNTTGTRQLFLFTDPEVFAATSTEASAPGPRQSTSGLVKLDAGDVVTAVVFQESNGSRTASAVGETFLAMHWVGPG